MWRGAGAVRRAGAAACSRSAAVVRVARVEGSGPRAARWTALWAALVVLGVLGPLLGRAAWEGQGALVQADLAAAEGRVDREIMQLGRAARWRVPIAGHDEQALARLLAIAAEAEQAGEGGTQTAITAYREARGALLASRAWGVADPSALDLANRGIARLMAAQEQVFGTDLSGTGRAEAYHLELLQRAGEGRAPWPAAAVMLTALFGALALRRGARRGRLVWTLLAGLGALATWLLRPF